MNAYVDRRRSAGAWITGYAAPRRSLVERVSCVLSVCLFGVLAWTAIDPHSFRAFVLGVLTW